MLAQLNDLCPKHKQRSCRASQAKRLVFFSKMRLVDLAARADHVAIMEAVEGHISVLFPESRWSWDSHDFGFSSHILGYACSLTGCLFLTWRREDLWGRGSQFLKQLV